MRETWVWSLGREDTLEKELATHSSIPDWKSHGRRSLVGPSPWGHKESDMTERLHFHGAVRKKHLFSINVLGEILKKEFLKKEFETGQSVKGTTSRGQFYPHCFFKNHMKIFQHGEILREMPIKTHRSEWTLARSLKPINAGKGCREKGPLLHVGCWQCQLLTARL